DVGNGETGLAGDLLVGRGASDLAPELVDRATNRGADPEHPGADPDVVAQVGLGALHRLAAPPGGVGGALAALPPVATRAGGDPAKVSVLDQVGHRDTHAGVPTGVGHDEPEVGLDEPLPGLFPGADERLQTGAFGRVELLARLELLT